MAARIAIAEKDVLLVVDVRNDFVRAAACRCRMGMRWCL